MVESESKDEKTEKQQRLDPELLKKGLRCDLDQYEMLKRCSEKRDMTEWNKWRERNPDEEILLEGANLSGAYLKGAYLQGAHLREAVLLLAHVEDINFMGADLESVELRRAHIEGAKLWWTNLKDADLCWSHLEGADLSGANLKGANCSMIVIDGSTLIWLCDIDRRTNFRHVGLNSARIDSGLKQILEYNIRRMNWEGWYKEHSFLKWLVKLFWLMSDYGLSTGRVIATFFILALFFAAIYSNLAYYYPPGIVSNLHVEEHLPIWHYFLLLLLRPIYFSVVTMTTLGFGDMYADAQSIWGHILLTVQVILGYVLLGALVTRFAVLFTAGGPAGEFAKEKKKGTKEK